jgi:hypothetical protein
MMAFMAGINPAVSTAVTREGKGHAMMICLPVSPRITALSKLALGYAMALIGCVPAAVVLMVLCVAALASQSYNPFIYFRF